MATDEGKPYVTVRERAVFSPLLKMVARVVGKVPLPARLLQRFVKGAIAAGILEALAPTGRDLAAPNGDRLLAVVRIVAALRAGCPFCVDMNAATWARSSSRVALDERELGILLSLDEARFGELGVREEAVARYTLAASGSPSAVTADSVRHVREFLSEDDMVVVAVTMATVHFWSRFNQALGVPSEGYLDACRTPEAERDVGTEISG